MQLALSYRHAESARHVDWLSRRRGRSSPWAGVSGEIKELSHIGLGKVSLGESGQLKPGFNQLERRGVVHWSMRYEILLGKR